MRRSKVPALLFSTPCFACGGRISFPLFVADCYDLRTYRGRATGDFYQLEANYNFEAELRMARDREGDQGVELVPEELTCVHCGRPAGVPRDALRGLSGPEAPQETLFEAMILP